ncbi:MAG: NnrS family protein [Arenicellales bacterium]|nr:NnrS family protein [Arenicellales bacterium]
MAVVLGFSTGTAILIMPLLGIARSLTWVTHSQSHGITQIFGWAGLFVMGIAYHVVPRIFSRPIRYPVPQKLSMWLVISGLLFRFIGQALYKLPIAGLLVALSGISLCIAMLVFAWALYGVIRHAANKSGPAEIWLVGGVVWSVLSGVIHLVVTFRMAIQSAPLGYVPWNEALIYAALFGFIASFIFGISARAIRGFLLLKPMHERMNRLSFVLVQIGLAVLVVGQFGELDQRVASVGLILTSVGAGMFILALRVLEPAGKSVFRIAIGYERYGWFVRSGFSWLLLGCVMLPLIALDEAGLTNVMTPKVSLPVIHVFTLGFVTNLIFGAASRFIPIFEGADIRHPRLMDAAFVFLTVSVVIRLGFGFSISQIGEHALGISGISGFIGMILFAIVVFQAMTQSARDAYTVRVAAFGWVKFEKTRGVPFV